MTYVLKTQAGVKANRPGSTISDSHSSTETLDKPPLKDEPPNRTVKDWSRRRQFTKY